MLLDDHDDIRIVRVDRHLDDQHRRSHRACVLATATLATLLIAGNANAANAANPNDGSDAIALLLPFADGAAIAPGAAFDVGLVHKRGDVVVPIGADATFSLAAGASVVKMPAIDPYVV